jgi:hypothetical protein
MSKKSKLNLDSIQNQFDKILKDLSKEDVLAWLEKDKEIQCSVMLTGAKISIVANSISYSIRNVESINNIVPYEYPSAA